MTGGLELANAVLIACPATRIFGLTLGAIVIGAIVIGAIVIAAIIIGAIVIRAAAIATVLHRDV